MIHVYTSAQDEASTKSSTEKLTLPDNRYLTGGLHSRLSIAVNARVSLTRNIDVSDGLVNGAVGVITHIAARQSHLLNGTIMIKFDNNRVGLKARSTVPANLRRIPGTPIKATTCRFAVGSTNTLYINRTQYPLTLSWSTTIHKVQGQSLDDVKVSFQVARFTAGQAYVALSRAKSMSGLHLSSFFPEKIKVNKLALLEMERLKSSRTLSWKTLITEHRSACNVIFLHLNIRSFRAHELDLGADEAVLSADLVALTETHVKAAYISCEEY